MKSKNVLIDTSIVLDGIHNVGNIDKDANVFVTDVVLRELDGNKGAEGSKGYNAREFFRQLNNHNFATLDRMPLTDNAVFKNDTLTEGEIDSGAHIFTISRKWYRAKDINDTKIIEIAKDYDLTLKTLDQAQCVRAKSQGIDAQTVKSTNGIKNLPMDGVVVLTLIFFVAFFVNSIAIDYAKAHSIVAYMIFFFIGAFVYMNVLKKVFFSNGTMSDKFFALFSNIVSMVLFIYGSFSDNIVASLMACVVYVVSAIYIYKCNVGFKSLSARYDGRGAVVDNNDGFKHDTHGGYNLQRTLASSGEYGLNNSHTTYMH